MRSLRSGAKARSGALGKAMLALAFASFLVAMSLVSASPAVAAPTPLHVPYGTSGPEVAWNRFVLVLNQESFPQDNRARLLKIDAVSNRIVGSLPLPFGPAAGPSGPNVHNLVVDHGTAWLTLFWRSELVGIDPSRMRITKRIPLLRSPSSVVASDGSLWVALQNGRGVERVDPMTGRLLGKVPVGRQNNTVDGPYQLAVDGSHVLATLPGSRRVAEIDTTTLRVRYDHVAPAMACANVLPVPGGYWLDDTECSNDLYRWSTSRSTITARLAVSRCAYGAAVLRGNLYTGEAACDANGYHAGYLVKRDLDTGQELSQLMFPRPAFLPWLAKGWIWLSDLQNGLRKVRPS
jgi:hypothetical protein